MTKPRVIKAVVWDLDNTLWDGVAVEGDPPKLREASVKLVRQLDERGVLQSIATRNEPDVLEVVERFGLREYFLHPRCGRGAKSAAVGEIAKLLDVSLRSVAFVDDEPFERAEVASVHAEVLCLDPQEVGGLLSRSDVTIPEGTGLNRRAMHIAELARRGAEEAAGGPSEAFMRSLEMRLAVRRAGKDDLARIQEMMLRTNQLNTTGRFIPMEELEQLCGADDHLVLVTDLVDRFGAYGTVGFALVRREPSAWRMRMLMMSCRVQDRGVGSALLGSLLRGSQRCGARFGADFARTPHNRRMYVTLKLAGFEERTAGDGETVLEADPHLVPPIPGWIQIADETGALLGPG